MAGRLQWATAVINAGRGFLRRLYDSFAFIKDPQTVIHVHEGLRSDLRVWAYFLQKHNGVVMMHDQHKITSSSLHLYTDASGWGAAGIMGNLWFQFRFGPIWSVKNIAIRELYPIMVAVYVFAEQLRDKHLVMYTDNYAVMQVINSQSSKCPGLMELIRQIVLVTLLHNIKFTSRHVPGVDNIIADELSRFQLDREELIAGGLHSEPVPIPPALLPSD